MSPVSDLLLREETEIYLSVQNCTSYCSTKMELLVEKQYSWLRQWCQCLILLSPSGKLIVLKSCIVRLCSPSSLSPAVVNIIVQTLPANVMAQQWHHLSPILTESEVHVYGNYINNHLRSGCNKILTYWERVELLSLLKTHDWCLCGWRWLVPHRNAPTQVFMCQHCMF